MRQPTPLNPLDVVLAASCLYLIILAIIIIIKDH